MPKLICLFLFAVTSVGAFSQFSASPSGIPVIPAGQGNNNTKLAGFPVAVQVPGGGLQSHGSTRSMEYATTTAVQTDPKQMEFGSLVVTPNPATDNLWVNCKLPEAGSGQIILYNYTGQKISELFLPQGIRGEVKQELNVSNYPSGIYFLTLNFISDKDSKPQTISQKVQIIHTH